MIQELLVSEVGNRAYQRRQGFLASAFLREFESLLCGSRGIRWGSFLRGLTGKYADRKGTANQGPHRTTTVPQPDERMVGLTPRCAAGPTTFRR